MPRKTFTLTGYIVCMHEQFAVTLLTGEPERRTSTTDCITKWAGFAVIVCMSLPVCIFFFILLNKSMGRHESLC